MLLINIVSLYPKLSWIYLLYIFEIPNCILCTFVWLTTEKFIITVDIYNHKCVNHFFCLHRHADKPGAYCHIYTTQVSMIQKINPNATFFTNISHRLSNPPVYITQVSIIPKITPTVFTNIPHKLSYKMPHKLFFHEYLVHVHTQ